METKTGFPSYKIIRAALNNIHVIKFSYKVPDIFVRFLPNLELTDFRDSRRYQFHENPSSGSGAVTSGQTDGWTDRLDEASRRFSPLVFMRTRLTKDLQKNGY
jgi:hypothetical protein